MLTIETIRTALADRNLSEVARRAELTYGQVYGFATTNTAHPAHDVVKALSDYLVAEAHKILSANQED